MFSKSVAFKRMIATEVVFLSQLSVFSQILFNLDIYPSLYVQYVI